MVAFFSVCILDLHLNVPSNLEHIVMKQGNNSPRNRDIFIHLLVSIYVTPKYLIKSLGSNQLLRLVYSYVTLRFLYLYKV